MNLTTDGLDIAKNVMQLHWVDAETGEIGRKKLARAKLSDYFAQLHPVRVVMEACGSAHHWARVLGALGHQVELLPARQVAAHRQEIEAKLPALMLGLIDGQLASLKDIEGRIEQLEAEIGAVQEQLDEAVTLRRVPGIGLLGATALAATLGDASGWKSGREFSASLGLVPAHAGTGGKVRGGHLTKRGDPYLRTLLMHGARSVIFHSKDKPQWLEQLLARRPLNVVVAALANKMARTAWALVAHGREYRGDWLVAGSGRGAAQAATASRLTNATKGEDAAKSARVESMK